MQTFIYLELTGNEEIMPYEKPVLSWVKTNWPDTTVLDIDLYSEHLLFDHAGRLIDESDTCVVYFRSSGEAPIHQAANLVEEIIRMHEKALVLLQGHHPFLHQLFTSRSNIRFFNSDTEDYLKERIKRFLEEGQE